MKLSLRTSAIWAAVTLAAVVGVLEGVAGDGNGVRSSESVVPANSLPQMAFDVIKGNKPEALPRIVMAADDFVALGRLENRGRGPELSDEQIKAIGKRLAADALAKATSRLVTLRANTEKTGFDWAAARLTRVTTRDGPFDVTSRQVHVDIYLTIEAGGQSIVVKLDDCFFVNGHRRIADGFRLQK